MQLTNEQFVLRLAWVITLNKQFFLQLEIKGSEDINKQVAETIGLFQAIENHMALIAELNYTGSRYLGMRIGELTLKLNNLTLEDDLTDYQTSELERMMTNFQALWK